MHALAQFAAMSAMESIPERLRAKHAALTEQQRLSREARASSNNSTSEQVARFDREFAAQRASVVEAIDAGDFPVARKRVRVATDNLGACAFFLPAYAIKNAQQSIDAFVKDLDTRETSKRSQSSGFRFARQESAPEGVVASQPDAVNDDTDDDDFLSRIQNGGGVEVSIRDLQLVTVHRTETANSLSLSNLSACTVSICHSVGALRIDGCVDCTILVGPIAGSAHIDGCTNCTIVVASRQIRVHTCRDLRLYMHANSHPIIEYCTTVGIAPYNFEYDGIERDWIASGLSRDNRYAEVQDFSWLHDGHSPNWSLIAASQRKAIHRPVEPDDDDDDF